MTDTAYESEAARERAARRAAQRRQPPRSLIQWGDETDPLETEEREAAKEESDQRARFFSGAADATPIVGVQSDDGHVFLVRTGEKGEGRLLFAKPGRPSASVRRLRKAVSLLQELGRLRDDEPRVYVDIGSEVGATVLAAIRDHGFSRAVSVDTNPDRCRLLQANAVLAGVTDRVHVICATVTDRDGLVVERRKRAWGSYRVLRGDDAASALAKNRAVAVPHLTLDGLNGHDGVELEDVKLLRISGVPNPFEVLRAAKKLPTTAAVEVEFDPQVLQKRARFQEIVEFLNERFPSLVDLNVRARDVIVTDSALVASIAERHVQAREKVPAQLLLFNAEPARR